jgi:hypothetical protein
MKAVPWLKTFAIIFYFKFCELGKTNFESKQFGSILKKIKKFTYFWGGPLAGPRPPTPGSRLPCSALPHHPHAATSMASPRARVISPHPISSTTPSAGPLPLLFPHIASVRSAVASPLQFFSREPIVHPTSFPPMNTASPASLSSVPSVGDRRH